MRLRISATALAFLTLRLSTCSPATQGDYPLDVSDRYIVTLKPGTEIPEHIHHVESLLAHQGVERDDGKSFAGVTHEYHISDFRGYAGHFDRRTADLLRQHDNVTAVEPDKVWTLSSVITQSKVPYGLSLISHRQANKPDYAYDSSAGGGTWAYVVDSGINVQHGEFEGRASNGYNAVRGEPPTDSFGHGTHVAALIGGKTYGVAKKTHLIGVEIFKGQKTTYAIALDGLQWAVNDILKTNRAAKAVINMSADGVGDKAINAAVREAIKRGISVVVSGGIRGAPTSWPSDAIVVAPTNQRRVSWDRADKSTRITLWAPGVDIRSAWIGSSAASRTMSGPSQAAGYVAGLVVYLKAMRRLPDPASTKQSLIMLALRNVVGNPGEAQNLFAYNGSGR
ncbi:hypothetical protein ANO11243_050310 [Dothideomycetidae sp. 11243]|nr:hypothetical protein ANO11243_050310 [fungal sp. No.11243]